MGMSSSQARLLSLTSRMHDIEYKAQKLEAQKLQLANDSDRVYNEYLDALDATKIQYASLNSEGSTTYLDASYSDLCLYNTNNAVQYGLVDTNTGKVYVPSDVKTKYDAAASASAFATSMSGYTPPVTPVNPDTSTETTGTSETSSTSETTNTTNTSNTTNTTYTSEPSHDSDETPLADNEPEDTANDITLSRGQSKTQTITSTAIKLTLTNPFTGSNYTYSVVSNNGSSNSATFNFLSNGRLQVTGNNLSIVASNNQEDDLIITGDNNYVDTGNYNDYVRIGYPYGYITTSNQNTYQSDSNTIRTGTGSDHVTVFGVSNDIDMGTGTNDSVTEYEACSNYNNITGDDTNLYCGNSVSVTDSNVQLSTQGGLGDCRFLSLLKSLNNLSNYVDITKSGDNYTVNFKNCTAYSTHSITVSQSEIDDSGYSEGDIDVRVTEYALNKLIKNRTSNNYDLESTSYQEYSRYMFGSSNVSMYLSQNEYASYAKGGYVYFQGGGQVAYNDNTKITKALMQQLYSKYKNGQISNLEIGMAATNDSLQFTGSHAYAVNGVYDEYIELINPWDNEDVLRLDWSTYLDSVDDVIVYNDTTSGNLIIGELYNGSSSTPVAAETTDAGSDITTAPVKYIGADGDSSSYQYYVNLYNLIQACGGCIAMSDGQATNINYLTNIIEGGFAYLKTFDNTSSNWIDTSVSTNTKLRETSNEINLKKAEAKYEADMKRIDRKDAKYDTQLAAIETERTAIKEEVETLKTVAKENVERTFKLFS